MDNAVPDALTAPNKMPRMKKKYIESTQAQFTIEMRTFEASENTDKVQGTDSYSESEDMEGDEESPILTTSVSEKQLFTGLKEWLMSIDRTLKNEKVAQMHVSHVIHINRAVETGMDHPNYIRNLFDAAKVKEHWLNSFLNEKQPGTVKSYLNSPRIICKFLKEYELVVDVAREIENFEVTIGNWMKSLQKRLTIRRWETTFSFLVEEKGLEMGEEAEQKVGYDKFLALRMSNFLAVQGFKTSGTHVELVARPFAAGELSLPVIATSEEHLRSLKVEYGKLISDIGITDPQETPDNKMVDDSTGKHIMNLES
eukprot:gene5755-11028_t